MFDSGLSNTKHINSRAARCAFFCPALCEVERAMWTLLSCAWRHFAAQRRGRAVRASLNGHSAHYWPTALILTEHTFPPLHLTLILHCFLLFWDERKVKKGNHMQSDIFTSGSENVMVQLWQLSGYPPPIKGRGSTALWICITRKKRYWFLIW